RSEREKPGVPTKASLLVKHQVRAVNSGAFEGVSEGFFGGCGDVRLCQALRCRQPELLSVRNAEDWGWARLCGPAPHREARGDGSRPHPPRPAEKSGGLSRSRPPSRGTRRRRRHRRDRTSPWGSSSRRPWSSAGAAGGFSVGGTKRRSRPAARLRALRRGAAQSSSSIRYGWVAEFRTSGYGANQEWASRERSPSGSAEESSGSAVSRSSR